MALLENAVAAWITVFSVLLTVVAALAYRRSANPKVLGLVAAFAFSVGKGAVVTWALFTATRLDAVWVAMGLFDTGMLLAFYLSALKR